LRLCEDPCKEYCGFVNIGIPTFSSSSEMLLDHAGTMYYTIFLTESAIEAIKKVGGSTKEGALKILKENEKIVGSFRCAICKLMYQVLWRSKVYHSLRNKRSALTGLADIYPPKLVGGINDVEG